MLDGSVAPGKERRSTCGAESSDSLSSIVALHVCTQHGKQLLRMAPSGRIRGINIGANGHCTIMYVNFNYSRVLHRSGKMARKYGKRGTGKARKPARRNV
ncbi:hypothetical protein Ae201684P_011566 [Aphanomyces euteiches]|uniref:Uncharacterized protein n=1 Tax=Aphanomyces euteiches TaxID=100861 RepID=A0A6G0XWL8_9STRA|nr:hypothetical protein Ae201684_000518 [Aphanomyces euteiches]KAH9092027.1 hypothetical protein Ae201684P_011566 [Aphanomyces euteiches]